MEFEYYYSKIFMNTIDINNQGNCFIEALNDKGIKVYLWIKTDMGYSKILEAGPFIEDGSFPLKECHINYEETFYNLSKIKKKINSFLNNPKYEITQAYDRQEEYDEKDKLSRLYNIINYMEDKEM